MEHGIEIHLIKGDEYQFAKIDAIAQFHVVRRLAPLIGELFPIFSKDKFKDGVNGIKEEALEELKPLLDVFSKLPDADLEYCIFALCKKVYKKNLIGGGWAPIINAANGFQFVEMKTDLALVMQITAKALGVNLSGFINALPTSLNVGAPQIVK